MYKENLETKIKKQIEKAIIHNECKEIAYKITKFFNNTNFNEIFKICNKCMYIVINILRGNK